MFQDALVSWNAFELVDLEGCIAVKNVLTLVVAVVVGAGGFWAFQSWTGKGAKDAGDAARPTVESPAKGAVPSEPPESASPSAVPPAKDAVAAKDTAKESGAAKPTFAKKPIFFDGDAKSSAPDGSLKASTTPPTESPAVKLAAGTALDSERAVARTAFDSGDKKRGIRLLEDLFQSAKDRPDVDLSADALRLLESETRLERKREYLQYLARLDRTGRVLDDQLARAARKTATAEDGPDAGLSAWDELALAYDVAQDRGQRKRVLGQLDPFIQRMIFSGRFTPLLKSYQIQNGDSLSQIAAKFQTTQDSMRRINGLKGETIQPRQRLRILPGKLKIFVDKSDFILWATLDDRIFFEFPVGTGRDNGTPLGAFAIRVRQKDPTWWRPGEAPVPAGDPKNVLGSRWLGFQETQDFAGFGIHGTSDPSSLGKESSAGCIRMRNEDIEILYDFVTIGTEVQIRA